MKMMMMMMTKICIHSFRHSTAA